MKGLEKHSPDFSKDGDAWKDYTLLELAMWVVLLRKRATMRTDKAKQEKDLYDANNYLEMLKEKHLEIQEELSDESTSFFPAIHTSFQSVIEDDLSNLIYTKDFIDLS